MKHQGFAGYVTSVTGISSAKIAMSEIGVSNPDESFGPQKNGQGIPFSMLMRDVLMLDTSLAEAKARIRDAHRTVDLILGVGDGNLAPAAGAPFSGVQYSASAARFFNDSNLLPVASCPSKPQPGVTCEGDWHPRIPSVVYQGMDWLCPEWTSRLGELLKQHHGQLTPALTVREITARVQTGDLHIAIYSPAKQLLHISLSVGTDAPAGAPRKAFERPFMEFDLEQLWRVPALGAAA